MGVVEGMAAVIAAGLLFYLAYKAKRRVPVPVWIRTDLGENLLTLVVLSLGIAGCTLMLTSLLPEPPV